MRALRVTLHCKQRSACIYELLCETATIACETIVKQLWRFDRVCTGAGRVQTFSARARAVNSDHIVYRSVV